MKGYSVEWLACGRAICLLTITAAQQPGLATAAADDKNSYPAASNTSMATSELAPAQVVPALGQLIVAPPACELSMLTLLGQQDFYNASGYNITTELPDNFAPEAWQSLGCLKSVTSLSLTGSLPGLPDSWADSGCFPALQLLNLSGILPNAAWDYNNSTLPLSWSSAEAFPALAVLVLESLTLSGSLPAEFGSLTAFQQLETLYISDCGFTGTLPVSWANNGSLPALLELDLVDINLTGSLPAAWASPAGFQQLLYLSVINAGITGVLPTSWSDAEAFPSLQYLDLERLSLSGSLPPQQLASCMEDPPAVPEHDEQSPDRKSARSMERSWYLSRVVQPTAGRQRSDWYPSQQLGQQQRVSAAGVSATAQMWHLGHTASKLASKTGFPRLRSLELGENTKLSGNLPASWSSHDAFPHLEVLVLAHTGLNGSVPAFNNGNLSFVDLNACHFTSDLGAFLNSSAPLTGASLSNNRLSGNLPNTPPFLGSLTFLDISNNSIQGTLPLSWLAKDSFLSHVSYLDVGQVWQRSLSMLSWRQQLCLHEGFYSPDVTGIQLTRLPALLQSLSGQEIGYIANSATTPPGILADVLARFFLSAFQEGGNQLTAVPTMCANNGAGQVLLILWVLFGGCCLIIVCLYACLCRLAAQLAPLSKSPWLQRLPARFLVSLCSQAFQGLGGLAFYYYDFITAIVVLAQVWRTWPGHVLTAIFFFHLATTGAIVAVHAAFRWNAVYNLKLQSRHIENGLVMLGSLIAGPIFIPVVLVLDTIAFMRQVALCIQGLAKSPGLKWLRPCYVSIFRVNRCVVNSNFAGLTWIDLESYESMHNLIAAVFQSLPTVILNSLLFSAGNKPSHGLFLSNNLFIAAIIASCLVMLKVLIVLLWQAHKHGENPIRHVVSLISGRSLASTPEKPKSRSSIELLTHMYEGSGSAPLGAPEVQLGAPEVQPAS
ncbi:hypothetical protein ABBQ38_000986 [Trebouxia sp. C0009 RCD-2024]